MAIKAKWYQLVRIWRSWSASGLCRRGFHTALIRQQMRPQFAPAQLIVSGVLRRNVLGAIANEKNYRNFPKRRQPRRTPKKQKKQQQLRSPVYGNRQKRDQEAKALPVRTNPEKKSTKKPFCLDTLFQEWPGTFQEWSGTFSLSGAEGQRLRPITCPSCRPRA
jgi:hypothetical protein